MLPDASRSSIVRRLVGASDVVDALDVVRSVVTLEPWVRRSGWPSPPRGRGLGWESHNRHNADMRIERSRENVFTVTATSQELSALVAGARMALEAMRAAPEPAPTAAIEILQQRLGDFD